MFEGFFKSLKRLMGGDAPAQSGRAPGPAAGPPPLPGPPQAPAPPSSPALRFAPAPPSAAPPPPRTKLREQPAPVMLEGLDGNPFAPLDDDEVKRRMSKLGRPSWSNPWFGRRDLIPPADDPRTSLIDRAMVAHGLLTPEDLTEIHAVGVEMDEVRPDLEQAHRAADAAVQKSKAEREAIKRQKKAEAAERKRQHAEAVARRKATDIVFLGRGVSIGLADRRSNVEQLTTLGLPVLNSPADVAQALGLTVSRLRWLAFHNPAAVRLHYVRFTVPKKSGGVRELAAPHRSLAGAQTWILENVLAKVALHDAAHGFVRGRSTVTNAAPHVGRRTVVNADLENFFPTITFPRVKGVFQSLGYSPAVATIFALLATEAPRKAVVYAGKSLEVATGPRALPQGAATSPALSNLTARHLDARLAGIAAKLGWTYTRYADDLTFSADGEAADKVGYLLARIRHITQDEGFAVNEKKTRVQRPNTAQVVTGLVVNKQVAVPREMVRRLRAILHRARREGLSAQNRDHHPHFEAWVRGMIAYVTMANPEQGRKLRAAYDALGH